MAEQRDLFAPGVAEAAPIGAFTGAEAREDLQARFAAFGLASLDEGDTLALVLERCLAPGADTVAAADALMARFGGIGRVVGAAEADLARVIGAPAARQLGLLHAPLLRALQHPLRQSASRNRKGEEGDAGRAGREWVLGRRWTWPCCTPSRRPSDPLRPGDRSNT
jgi:hypothetical protein